MLCSALSAHSPAQGEEQLWSLLETQTQARGSFVQDLYDEDNELLEHSSGRYAVLRPDFFRWEIDDPDRQMIVIAGHELWHYDIDLAAATRRDTRDTQEFTPLELLAGNSAELRQRFSVEPVADNRYRLIPLFAQAGFAGVEITWDQGEIVAMDVRDRSGQLISLILTPERDAPPLTPADFSFVPPDGVDVYDPER
jgi:chaperone LolA